MKRILFKGQEYLLLDGGAITTAEDYANWGASFAHYYPDRDAVMRYHEQIGTSKDFEVLEDNLEDPGPGTKSWDKFMDNAWFEPPKKVTDLALNDSEATTDPSNPPTPPQPKATEGK